MECEVVGSNCPPLTLALALTLTGTTVWGSGLILEAYLIPDKSAALIDDGPLLQLEGYALEKVC